MKKQPKRDANIPVLAWRTGETLHEIFVAGKDETVRAVSGRPGDVWGPESIVHRSTSKDGLNEYEAHLNDPTIWGWLGRLMATNEIPIQLLIPTDREADVAALRLDAFAGGDAKGGNGAIARLYFNSNHVCVTVTARKQNWYSRRMKLPPGVDASDMLGKTFEEIEVLYAAFYSRHCRFPGE